MIDVVQFCRDANSNRLAVYDLTTGESCLPGGKYRLLGMGIGNPMFVSNRGRLTPKAVKDFLYEHRELRVRLKNGVIMGGYNPESDEGYIDIGIGTNRRQTIAKLKKAVGGVTVYSLETRNG